MKQKEKDTLTLAEWQGRFERSLVSYAPILEEMDRRERLWRGDGCVEPLFDGECESRTPLVRNVIAENIESAINPSVPSPKVTAMSEEDSGLARMIEDMLTCELGRLGAEELNDLDERICPVQGSSFYNVEWDGAQGRAAVTLISPRMVIPQDGVTGSIEDMEYYFLRIPQTRSYIRSRWGVELSDESERYPEIRGEGAVPSSELVTQIFAYYKNARGGVGVVSWVGDTLIFADDDYRVKKRRVCADCGRHLPEGEHCPDCGGSAVSSSEEEELVYVPVSVEGEEVSPIYSADGEIMSAQPVRLPVYRVEGYPLIQRRNISVYGSFLGDSDVDKMASQQNVLNRLSAKMLKKSLGGGTVLSLPDDADITAEDTEGGELRIIRPRDAAAASLIRTFTLEGDISQDMALYSEAYEEARQQIGVTDSMQGRRDSTAQSGVAKQFTAAQSEGRFESKRVMKKAAWARIYEQIFRLNLAFSHGSRPISVRGEGGETRWGEFDRMRFVERREDGTLGYNDRFIFSCDDDTPLARNRSAMWREAAENLTRGAYGNPASDEALLLYWRVLESYNYPSAGMAREEIERRMRASAPSEIPYGEEVKV